MLSYCYLIHIVHSLLQCCCVCFLRALSVWSSYINLLSFFREILFTLAHCYLVCMRIAIIIIRSQNRHSGSSGHASQPPNQITNEPASQPWFLLSHLENFAHATFHPFSIHLHSLSEIATKKDEWRRKKIHDHHLVYQHRKQYCKSPDGVFKRSSTNLGNLYSETAYFRA